MNELRIENLNVGYGRSVVIEGVSGEVSEGDWIHLFGKNGSGKTSFLQVLATFHNPISGSIFWNDGDIHSMKNSYRAKIRYFGHEIGLFEDLSVQANWELFTGLFEIHGTSPRSFTGDIAPEKLVKQLSRGQKRRVELASLIASPREMILLDEPLSSLDTDAQDSLMENLNGIKDDGGIIFTASPEAMDEADENWQVKNSHVTKVT